jgi:hypothetical protein
MAELENWGVWCEQTKVWAHVIHGFRLEFLSEHDAAIEATKWCANRAAIEQCRVWVAKRISGSQRVDE